MEKRHSKIYDELTQELLYNKYILPYEEEIMAQIYKLRREFDEIMDHIQEETWYKFPYIKRRNLSKPLASNTIFDYPRGSCLYIRNYIYRIFGDVGQILNLGQGKHQTYIIDYSDINERIKKFKEKGGIIERVHLVVDGDSPYFQNVIQIGNRYLDTSVDQLKDGNTSIKLLRRSGQVKYREIKGFEDEIRINESYRGAIPISSEKFLGELSVFFPFIFIHNDGSLYLPTLVSGFKNCDNNFRFSERIFSSLSLNDKLIDLPSDVKTGLIKSCEIFRDILISIGNKELLEVIKVFLIILLDSKNNMNSLKKRRIGIVKRLKSFSVNERRDIHLFYAKILEKVLEIYNTLLYEGLID